jgi:hypothetical protein
MLAGWDVTAALYVAWTWATIWHRDPAATARLALREDPGRATADALTLVASVASVLAVVLAIAAGRAGGSGSRDLRAGLAVVSVALSWSVVQTVFISHYARLYYSHPPGGIDFNQEAPPRYSDFAYLAFTVGMTFQVSDPTSRPRRCGQQRSARRCCPTCWARSSWPPPSTWWPDCSGSRQSGIPASYQARWPLAVETPAGRGATLEEAQGGVP